ncbi:unnamed protein product [Caenorhabditis angaria]|uniref:Uncharacterized protein n=1 Tax=Caenorhabditis angaria TaxID=860376 RepID=A0A9P1ID69_9PELO|nr:unnamed protein product [Caenorhabditis angaria]
MMIFLIFLIFQINCQDFIDYNSPKLLNYLNVWKNSEGKIQFSISDWFCNEKASYSEILESCSSFAASLNHCCAKFQDCSGQAQLQIPTEKPDLDKYHYNYYENLPPPITQELCQSKFENCTKLAIRIPTPETLKCRDKLYSEIGGTSKFLPYSLPNGKLEEVNKNAPESIKNASLKVEFENIYDKCPGRTATISSCSQNFELCFKIFVIVFWIMFKITFRKINSKIALKTTQKFCQNLIEYSDQTLAADARFIVQIKIIGFLVLVFGASLRICVLLWRRFEILEEEFFKIEEDEEENNNEANEN